MSRLFLIESDEIYPLTEYEVQIMKKYLRECNKFLNGTKLFWCDELNERNINAAFVQYRSKSIFLKKPRNPFDLIPVKFKISKTDMKFYENVYEENLMQCVPYVVHELTHQYQFKHLGKILYGIYSLPFLYNVMLDKIAFENEKTAAIDLRLDVNLYGDIS